MKRIHISTATAARFAFVWLASIYIAFMGSYWLSRWLGGDTFWRISLMNSFAHITFLPLPIFLVLAVKLHARKVLLGLLPAVIVGMIWFVPYFVPKINAAPSGTTIQVLTLNVWGNNHDLSGVEAWVRQSGADIVMLQEVSPAYAKDSLPHLRDIYPYQSAQADPTRWGGNITLSRYPILSSEYIDLQVPGEPDPERLIVDVQGKSIAVYNVHLAFPAGDFHLNPPSQSFYFRVAFGFDDTKRNEQIAHLLDYLKSETHPFVMAGDFNTSDFSVTYSQLAAQLRARGLPSFLPPLIRIDYIWHNDGLRTVESWQGPPVGSDHLPLLATLELVS